MHKQNRVISTLVLIAFICNPFFCDIGLAQELFSHNNSATLATSGRTDDIMGNERQHTLAIAMVFNGLVKGMQRARLPINPETLRDPKGVNIEKIDNAQGMRILRHEAKVDTDSGIVTVRAWRYGLRYVIEYDPAAGSLKVYPQDKEAVHNAPMTHLTEADITPARKAMAEEIRADRLNTIKERIIFVATNLHRKPNSFALKLVIKEMSGIPDARITDDFIRDISKKYEFNDAEQVLLALIILPGQGAGAAGNDADKNTIQDFTGYIESVTRNKLGYAAVLNDSDSLWLIDKHNSTVVGNIDATHGFTLTDTRLVTRDINNLLTLRDAATGRVVAENIDAIHGFTLTDTGLETRGVNNLLTLIDAATGETIISDNPRFNKAGIVNSAMEALKPADSPLLKFQEIGQQIWLDGLTWEMVKTGKFEELVRVHNITGVTTNPSLIKAYLNDKEVMADIAMKAAMGMTRDQIYFEVIKELVQAVIGVFNKCGVDGKFSVELNPEKADDVAGSVAEAKMWTDIDPEHMMVKVAATEAGYKIIEEVTAIGRNVNATLIFTMEQYEEVAWAYIRGLERAQAAGIDKSKIYSVASFFVSRWDVELAKSAPEEFQGRIANSIIIKAYNEAFVEIFNSQRFKALEAKGARKQDFLVASTASKGADMVKKEIIPAEFAQYYPPLIYVEPIEGANVVNTLPVGTITAMIDGGVKVSNSVVDNYSWARRVLSATAKSTDLAAVGKKLFDAGMKSFLADFATIMGTIDEAIAKAKELKSAENAIQNPGWALGIFADLTGKNILDVKRDYTATKDESGRWLVLNKQKVGGYVTAEKGEYKFLPFSGGVASDAAGADQNAANQEPVSVPKSDEITQAISLANEAGLQIPTIADKQFTLLATSEFFANGELKEQQEAYGDRFKLDKVSGSTADQFIANVLANPNVARDRTIVLLPNELAQGKFENKHYQTLKDAGIRFIIANRNELLSAKYAKDGYRKQFQQDTYAMMLLMRALDEKIDPSSSIYRLLSFYLKTHFNFTEKIVIDDYIMAIAKNEIGKLIQGILAYRPIQAYDKPDYGTVAATLMAA